jgi:hypothetical protein
MVLRVSLVLLERYSFSSNRPIGFKPPVVPSLTMPALPSPKRGMQAGNDETDCLLFCLGDTVGIQSKYDQILASR